MGNRIQPKRYLDGFRLKQFAEPKHTLAGYCPWTCMIDDGIVLLKTGALMRSYIFSCPDIESVSDAEINIIAYRFNRAAMQLGSGWGIQIETQRYKTKEYPSGGEFDNPAAYIIEKCREKNFKTSDEHFASSYYLAFTYQMESDLSTKASRFFFTKDTSSARRVADIQHEIDAFITTTDKIADILRAELTVDALGSADALTYLHTSVSRKWHAMAEPPLWMFLDRVITDTDIENTIPLKLGDEFIPIVSIYDFPIQTYPAIFDALNRVNIEYRWSTRFISLNKQEGLREIEKWQKKFHGGKKSVSQLVAEQALQFESSRMNHGVSALEEDVNEAQIEAMTDVNRFGYYTSTLMVWDTDMDRAQAKARYLEGVVSSCGFTSKQETVNAFNAWLSMQPGNMYANVRRPLVSSGNLSHMIPLSSVWTGMRANDFTQSVCGQQAPLLVCSSADQTPFFFNLNVGEVGHAFIFGPTGAGKSTLLNLIEIQALKYKHANVIILDKDKSARCVTIAAGGVYAEPGNDSVSFQPLEQLETQPDITWATEFIELLLEQQEVAVTVDITAAIIQALKLMQTIDKNYRTLTTFAQYVSYSNPVTGLNDIQYGLTPYLAGGQYGSIFDGDATTLPLSKWTMIEMGALMKLKEAATAPALMFIFKYIERLYEKPSGTPYDITLLILDEAWVFLNNKTFRAKIEEWLATLRKKRVFCVFATQNVSSAKESDIAPIIAQCCLTKLYLADKGAKNKAMHDGYSYFGLTDDEINLIQTARMKRDYFYKSPYGKKLFMLDLDATQLAIISSDPSENAFLDELERAHGRNSGKPLVFEILKHKGIPYEHFFKETL